MLTISKVFTILCLFCLCKEYPGSFQNKLVSSSLKWVHRYILFLAKLKREGRAFLELAKIDLSLKLSISCGGNFNYYKSVYDPIPTLIAGMGNTWQFSKEVSKLSFPLSVQIFFLLSQTKGERKTFFERWKKVGHIVRLPQEHSGVIRDEKSLLLWNLK